MWRETINRLDFYTRCVQEGQGLDAARNFANYVQWSGMCKLFEAFPCSESLVKVDGPFLRWKAEELERTVQDIWRTGKHEAKVEASRLDEINHKLNLIAGRLAQFAPPASETPAAGSSPALRVIHGGAA